jgi:hypothetical protein
MSSISPLLQAHLNLAPEDEASSLARYKRFGAGFYAQLYSEHPELRGKFRFFRDSDTEDIWSVCETEAYSFGVQLDPDTEVICLWDNGWSDEIGTWVSDPIKFAIETLRNRYLKRA